MTETLQYDVACNFDPALIDFIAGQDKKSNISTLFGKLKHDLVGGGRPSFILPDISLPDFRRYVDLCHDKGLKFNYLLNSLCLGNREISPQTHQAILRFVGELVDIGVDGFTLNSPLLTEVIKTQYPETFITTGHHARVSNIQQIAYWERLGATGITLHQSMSRNFAYLEKVLRYTARTGTTIRLIANNICLHDCPFQLNHATSFSHGSHTDGNPLTVDYNLLSCNNEKVANPVKLISSEWIRPEDVRFYRELCQKTQNYNLKLKLVERTKTTDFLSLVLKAYLEESYDGNMIDYVNWHTQQNNRQFDVDMFRQTIDKQGFSSEKMSRVREVYRTPRFYIDNKKLDGFLEKFITRYDCHERVCDDEGWQTPDNAACSYCRRWAEKCVQFDTGQRIQWLEKSNHFLKLITSSELFETCS